MMRYPHVFSEDETLDRGIAGESLSRYGDGELRLATGGNCISQRETSPRMVEELLGILRNPPKGCLVCIPNALSNTPKRESWLKYAEPKYTRLYAQKTYGSSFITRPDSAPWIDRPEYWEKVRSIWEGKHITLVTGGKNGLRAGGLSAASIRTISGPDKNAYSAIDRLEEEVGKPAGTVIMSLGVTATILAARLARRGVHALDLGHIGMFAKHAGAYRYQLDDLISPEYRALLAQMHQVNKWGRDGWKHAQNVRDLVREVGAVTILDYGSGAGTLAEALSEYRVQQFEPSDPARCGMPKPCDLVVATDVLEHVEAEKLSAVLDHIYRISGKAAYLAIATRPANRFLPDGRNAHLIVEDSRWWAREIMKQGWTLAKREDEPEGKWLRLWLLK